jgi:O-antigen/teichoic acid export membrane protein
MSQLLRAGFLLTGLNVAAGILGYAFQVLMGRVLVPEHFTVFSAMMALGMVCSSPLAAMVMVLARRVAALRAADDLQGVRTLFQRTNARLALGITVFAVAFLLLLRPAQIYLRAPDALSVWLFWGCVSVLAFFLANSGFLQGLQCFGWLGGLGVFAVVTKIVACVAMIQWLGWSLHGALGGVLVSTLVSSWVGACVIRSRLPTVGNGTSEVLGRVNLRSVVPVIVANVAFAAMTQLDVVLVNHHFNPEIASQYAAAAILGKAILYLPGGIVVALFPMVAEDQAKSRSSTGILQQSIMATLLLCGAVAFFYAFWGPWLVSVLYGGRFPEAGNLLALYGVAMLPITFVMIAKHFMIARGQSFSAWLLFLIAALEFVVIHFWHPSEESIIGVMAVGNVLAALGSAFFVWIAISVVRRRAGNV